MKKKIILNWLLVMLWMGVIYYFSNQPSLKSELEPIWDLVFRKIAHMAEFFVLAFFLFRAYLGNGLQAKKSLILAFIITLAYAAFDEWHQTTVFGRSGSIIDVGVDSIGALIFVVLQTAQKNKK